MAEGRLTGDCNTFTDDVASTGRSVRREPLEILSGIDKCRVALSDVAACRLFGASRPTLHAVESTASMKYLLKSGFGGAVTPGC